MLLHVLVLFSLHAYLHPVKKVAHSANILSVRLINAPPAAQRPPHQKKVLSIKTPSPIQIATKTSPTPVPQPAIAAPPAPPSAVIGGIAMPGAIASPFSGFKPEANALYQQRNAQQHAMRAYQEHVMAMQGRQQAEREVQFLTRQLQQMLEAIFNSTTVSGNCQFNTETLILKCSASELDNEMLNHAKPISDLFERLLKLGKKFNGFNVIKNNDKSNIIITNEHLLNDTH